MDYFSLTESYRNHGSAEGRSHEDTLERGEAREAEQQEVVAAFAGSTCHAAEAVSSVVNKSLTLFDLDERVACTV
jgi:16S rRNA G966 N2-methylase RsmD